MNKPKRQITEKNVFQYFLDEYIFFRRDFYFEVAANPEILMDAINNLYDDTGSWWWRKRRIIPRISQFQGQWQFELVAEQPSKSGYSQSAKAEGAIYGDENSSILEGQITIGSWGYFFFVILIGFFALMTLFSSQIPVSFFLIYGLFGLGFWIRSYRDRNHLFNLIQNAVASIPDASDETGISAEHYELKEKTKYR